MIQLYVCLLCPGVQLVSVRRARTDETTYQVPVQTGEDLELPGSSVPVPVPMVTSEPASEEAMDQLQVQSTIPAGTVLINLCYEYHNFLCQNDMYVRT